MTSKPNRTYRQSAVIPYRKENDRIEIILITSRSSKRWIFPKAIIEPIMTTEASTAKEALEEAGVIGHASSTLISEYEYEKWAGFCNVQVYALEVTQLLSEWDEMDFRKRMVVEISEAIELIKKNQRPSLERLRELLSS